MINRYNLLRQYLTWVILKENENNTKLKKLSSYKINKSWGCNVQHGDHG